MPFSKFTFPTHHSQVFGPPESQTIKPQYAGGTPGQVAGVIQVNIPSPTGTQAGNAVPLVMTVGNVSSQAGVTITVR